ncbi:hypothetical protein pVco14_074 [Vibrio phage pVco-14]|nr:hypothetical protein pVco14_074 [Vibrio phage pVco-14]
MAKVTTTICDNCGVEITDGNNSNGYIRLVYPSKQHDGYEGLESNDLCKDCYSKAFTAVRQALTPQSFTLHEDAASVFLDN